MATRYYDRQVGDWRSSASCAVPGLFLISPEQASSCTELRNLLRHSEDQRLYCKDEEIILRLPVALLEEDARFGTVARVSHLIVQRDSPERLIIIAEDNLLTTLQQDWIRGLQQNARGDLLQRILLNIIYSHERVARVLVDRLQELRMALKTSMSNREMRQIMALNRDLGELVIALREIGLILRDALRATPGDTSTYPLLDAALREQRRMEDVVNLVYERYLTVTNAYNGIIQNNAHTVMKVMTVWLALLMIPIAFIMPFHMNTFLPLEHWHYLWFGLIAYVFGVTLMFAIWARKRGFFTM
ncbi:CorA family divalent cation transporter [Acidithiobacillus thiooxidans]|uniref:CorA family divalent cation transporter n=1 Tax=Acidithiobacillus thiooxidans TaxID=930 RepID=UPI0029C15AC5|nr:CorA family divalent cation transporter [Acidithiobacillus thiooxidans]MDX5935876.1 CorA family divalent cation transporter [Acidithiobacillus thiooxidans]